MELSCTSQCKFINHGDIITAAISKRSISDENLCAFLNYTCCNCQSVKDSCGRDALHVAASCGRLNLVKWLIEKRHAAIDAQDDESGVTPLQRSIFYGHLDVAVELIKLGASLSKTDADGLTALEHAMKDKPRFYMLFSSSSKSLDAYVPPEDEIIIAEDCRENWEIYAWGFNTNHILGSQEAKTLPEYWENFHKVHAGVQVSSASLNQFHSLVITRNGNVYSCGHGQGGRLGLGVESTIIKPKLIVFKEKGNSRTESFQCRVACASKDHSLFLGADETIYSCGLNKHRVLGLGPDPPEKELSPRRIKSLVNIKGICAGQFHSVAWTNDSIYTWGLNAGQLGHQPSASSKYIILPRRVKMNDPSTASISHVAASDAATAFITKSGDVFVLHEYMCRKIASKELALHRVSVFGGKLNTQVDEEFKNYELKVVVLTISGFILVWQESDQKLRRCYFSINRALIINQVFLNLNEILFTTSDREAFKGYFTPRKNKVVIQDKDSKPKSEFHKFIEKNDCVFVKLEKIPKIHRARAIYSDPKGKDYFVVQFPPYTYHLMPQITDSTYNEDFKESLEAEDENTLDISFNVDNEVFKAHKYILASRSDIFQEMFNLFRNDCIKLTNIIKDDFKRLLDNIYGNLKISYKSARDKVKNRLAESESEVNFLSLQKLLKDNEDKNFYFQLNQLPEYYDVTVKCTDGELRAHKCVLSARVTYFNSLFSTRWSSCIEDITFPVSTSIAKDILLFIYTDKLTEYDDIDRLSKILVLSDQLLISRLKDICELFLSRQIKLKNAVQLLKFATRYNALQLKVCCLEFISSNLAEFLELQLLDDLEIDLLKELSETYIKIKSQMWCRIITPYSTAPSDEDILSISSSHPINLEEELIKKSAPKSSQKRRRPRTISTQSIEETTFEMQLENVVEDNNKENETKLGENEAELDNVLKKRLQAINSGMVKLEKENITEDYMNLKIAINTKNVKDFPDLNSPPKLYTHNKINTPKSEGKIKINKLSQRAKKRLYSEGNNNTNGTPLSESPKNPWKVIPPTSVSPGTSPGAGTDAFSGINAIVINEKKQKENLNKIKSKPLFLTQIEEAAIDDLYKFYNVDNIFDEIIEIQRVSIGDIATPTWVPSSKS